MRSRTFAALTLILTAAGGSSAQPMTAFGFDLGKPLELAECPFKMVGTIKLYNLQPPQTCVQEARKLTGIGGPVRRIVFAQTEAPPIVKNGHVFSLEEGGAVVGMSFLTPGAPAQQVVLEQFVAKYGAPTRQSTHIVQNAMGATLEAVTAVWEFPALRISFDGMVGKIDTGEVIIDTPAAVAIRQKWAAGTSAAERKL